ncbi:hypothetical protein AB8U03_15560 [Clostridium sp. Mt-5]|uniref:Uncharacterized protein n=1 Tax=Clostridium moutaii TaxID=3240932 RepID=A0ABV4BV75_9CLOT
MILAIDPGNEESAFVLLENNLSVNDKGKVGNKELLDIMYDYLSEDLEKHEIKIAIEMVASYGMAVGREVFDTCVWIGRFFQHADRFGYTPTFIYRKDEKMDLCHSMKANDSTITQALVDRFAYGVRNHGKGTKKEKGWFYGFKKDIWQAYAVGVTYFDKYLVTENANEIYNK